MRVLVVFVATSLLWGLTGVNAQEAVQSERTVQTVEPAAVPATGINPPAASRIEPPQTTFVEDDHDNLLAAPLVGPANAFPANPHDGDRVQVAGHRYSWRADRGSWKLDK